tara:strand:+ start:2544 stop:3632 length:1089 start_codon:yes stop_codon:yes gene_type:complete
MFVPPQLFLIAFGWVGILVACAVVPERAFSGTDAANPDTARPSGRILRVGPGRMLKKPSDAASVVRRGDTVRIDAGSYADCAVWRTPGITLTGDPNGETQIRDISCDGKALWVFYDGPATVRHIRFSGAKVARRNGAGIRWEGRGRLTVRQARFDGNQMGILTHNRRISSLHISHSRFDGNGNCPEFCGHAVYAGAISRLVVQASSFRNHRFGHHIKSRALVSLIVGNTLSDGVSGTSSYAINLPNSGSATIRGNSIQKGPLSDNIHCAICIGEEIVASETTGQQKNGQMKRAGMSANPSNGILIAQNAFRNESGAAETVFVWNRGPHPVTLRDNILTGPGTAYFVGPKPDKKPKPATTRDH